jgi:hypothetical protein
MVNGAEICARRHRFVVIKVAWSNMIHNHFFKCGLIYDVEALASQDTSVVAFLR